MKKINFMFDGQKLSKEQMKRVGGGGMFDLMCGDFCEGYVPFYYSQACACTKGGDYAGECSGLDGCTSCNKLGVGFDMPGTCDVIHQQ